MQADLYHQRKADHLCVRCGKPAAPDSDYCAPHEMDQRWREAKAQARRRAAFRKRKLCGCGRKPMGKLKLCGVCRTRLNSLPLRLVNKAVNKRSLIAERTVVDKEGRSRFLGQSRRGAPSVAKTDDWHIQLAVKELAAAVDGHAYYQSAEVQAMPRIQREDIRQAYQGRAFAAARSLLIMNQAAGWTIPGLNDDDE